MSLEIGFSWRDQYGRSAKTGILLDPSLDSNADMEALRALLQACSDGSIDDEWQTHFFEREDTPVAPTNTAMSVKDTIKLIFVSSVGKLVTVVLIKPLLEILTDDEVLDKAHELVLAIKAKALLYLKDNAGNPIVDLIEGYRARNKKRVK